MNSGGDINIWIKKSDATGNVFPTAVEPEIVPEEQGLPSMQENALNVAIINAGKKIMLDGFQIMSKLNGNYYQIDMFNQITTISTDAMTIIKGGWIGVVAVAANYGIKALNSFANQYEAERLYAMTVDRIGNVASVKSRGG